MQPDYIGLYCERVAPGCWLLSFEQGQAGVFTIPVAQALQHIENAFNAPPPQQ